MIIAVFIAMFSRAEPSANAWNMRVSSRVNDFPALPDGILKRFLLQCMVSL